MSIDPNIQYQQHVFTNKKFRDSSDLRVLELDNIKSQNSNPYNLIPAYSPVAPTAITNNTTPYMWIVNRKLIKLMDTWNRLLCSGFIKFISGWNTYKIVGTNGSDAALEYPFKTVTAQTPNFSISAIYIQLLNFFKGVVQDLNSKDAGARSNTGYPDSIRSYINLSNNIYDPFTFGIIKELLEIFKSLISEEKLKTKIPALTSKSLLNLDSTGGNGRGNFALLPSTEATFISMDIIEEMPFPQYQNPTTGLPVSISLAEKIDRNTESEPWLYRNVVIKYTDNTRETPKVKRKYTTQLTMSKPLVFNSFYINWNEPDSRPFVMIYNGLCNLFIPSELKFTQNKNDQPDSSFVISAQFYEIGTSNIDDTNYNPLADIKLNTGGVGGRSLYETTKLDFFDNLTIYHKLD